MDSAGEDREKPRRSARVNRDADGDPIGIAVFVTADELREMGIDPDRVNRVGFRIADDRPHFNGHE